MPSWAPTATQVKALVPRRANQRPFDTTTVPTLLEVQGLVLQICDEVVGDVGGFDPTIVVNPEDASDSVTLGDLAKWAATLGAAAYVELGFPVGDESQPAGDKLYARYKDAITRLGLAIAGKANPAQAAPLHSFPPALGWPDWLT